MSTRLHTHHNLDLQVADLQVVFVVDVHPLEGTSYPLVCAHQENDSETTCRETKHKA
jgi:hypothetical protein